MEILLDVKQKKSKNLKLKAEIVFIGLNLFASLRKGNKVLGSGSAYLNPEDKWDELFGMRLALKRASKAAYYAKIDEKIPEGWFLGKTTKDEAKDFVHRVDGAFRLAMKQRGEI